jgi:hypothetical protein
MSPTMSHFTHQRVVPFQAANKLENSILQIAMQTQMATQDVEDIVLHRQVMVTGSINLVAEYMPWIGVLKEFESGLSRGEISPKIFFLATLLQMDGHWFDLSFNVCWYCSLILISLAQTLIFRIISPLIKSFSIWRMILC